MYHLFQSTPIAPIGDVIVPQWSRIQEGLRAGVSRVIEYRRLNPKPLDGNHILVRLLDNLTVSKKLPLEIFEDKVIDLTFDITSMLGMTSSYSKGKVFSPGWFYGDNVNEVVIATIEAYDLNQMRTNWRSMRPIRVLYHPLTDLTLGVPDGKTRGTEGGPAVIVVNVPMLAAQYKMWELEENSRLMDSRRSIGQFLQQYPLPNMLHSHVDVAITNRIIARYFEIPMPKARNPHSIYMIDWETQVDTALDVWLDMMRKKRHWTFDTLLSSIPSVFTTDYHKVIRTPEGSFTRQLQWAVVIARLALLTFLVKFNSDIGNQANEQYLSRLRIYLRRMDLDKIMKEAMSLQRYDEIMTLINVAIKPYL